MTSAHEKDSVTEKPLTSVMEDYLEAIFDLDQEKKFIRVKDIAKRMDVKMPTVSSMLKTLNDREMVNYEKYEYVELTKDDEDVGKEMRRRHEILRNIWLMGTILKNAKHAAKRFLVNSRVRSRPRRSEPARMASRNSESVLFRDCL